MKHSLSCLCGYETPLVENEDDVDTELIAIHQQGCRFKPNFANGKMVMELKDEEIVWNLRMIGIDEKRREE